MAKFEFYTGVKVINARTEIIDEIYKNKKIEIFDNRYTLYENMFVIVKDEIGGQQSALCIVKGNQLHLIPENINVQGIIPRNKEQKMAMSVLLDENIRVVALTGRAGVGKTLISMAASVSLLERKVYQKMIITKTMSQVGGSKGKRDIGFLPGELNEKFNPFNQGVFSSLEFMVKGKDKMSDLIKQCRMEFIPSAIVRGSSWHDAIILVDEAQNMTPHELLTLGTRISQGSKIILLGDLKQIDEGFKAHNSGIYKFINHEKTKASKIAASLELIKNERGEASTLFAEVLEEEED
jgi:PhoH-like ATPase